MNIKAGVTMLVQTSMMTRKKVQGSKFSGKEASCGMEGVVVSVRYIR